MNNYYSILSISTQASSDEIKRTYKKLAVQYHPDKNPDDSFAEEKFKLINEAYQVLSDPVKKAQYNHVLKYGYAPHREEPEPQRNYYRGKKVRPEPRKLNLLYVYIFFGFAVFITAGFFFFSFMEKKAAKSIYEDAERLYYKENNPRAALDYLQLALEKDGSLSEAHFLTGKILYDEAADYQSSMFYFDNAVFEGNGTSDSIGIFYFWRGKNKIKLGNHLDGVNDLEAAYAYIPNDKALNLLLGDTHVYKIADYEKALFYYEQVLLQDSKNYDALLGKGVTLQKKAEYSQAEKYFDNAAYLRPNAPEIWYYQALQALSYKQDTLQACQLWQKASENGVKEAKLQMDAFCD